MGLVAENLRASHYGAIPVLDRIVLADEPGQLGSANAALTPAPRVLGLVDERDLARAVLPVLAHAEAVRHAAHDEAAEGPAGVLVNGDANGFAGHAAGLNGANGYHPPALDDPVDELADVATLTARDVMRQDFGIVPAMFSLHNALLTLDRYDSAALPVVDPMGGYRGMVSRADIVAALGQQVRPPVVGGMATPLGVWLTTGSLNAGAPPLGLVLSGMTMAVCVCIAHLALLIGLSFISQEGAAMFESGRLGATSSNGTVLDLAVTLIQGLLFLVVLRALPMAGIHAAEHQTVWAIERGLPLTPEYVAQMPRAHPRCGTNLVALGGLIEITFQHLPDLSGGTVVAALLFIYLVWRRFGTLLQEWFTTRPATRKQLESGIKAGRELLQKYQEQPHVMGSFGARLLNSGIAGAAGGMMLVLFAYGFLETYVARLVLH